MSGASGPGGEALTPERVFRAPDLDGPDAIGAQPSPDGSLVTFLRAKSADEAPLDLWAVPSRGDAPAFMLVDSATVSGAGAPLGEAEAADRAWGRVRRRRRLGRPVRLADVRHALHRALSGQRRVIAGWRRRLHLARTLLEFFRRTLGG